jgi:hypothetical protein
MNVYFEYFNIPDDIKVIELRKYLHNSIQNGTFKCLTDPTSYYNGYKIVGILFGDIYAGIDNYYMTIDRVNGFEKRNGDLNNYVVNNSTRNNFKLVDNNNKPPGINIYMFNTNQKNIMYNSHNDTLTFKKNEVITSFILNRTKINSLIYLVKGDEQIYVSSPGELIDITIPKKNDAALQKVYHLNEKNKIDLTKTLAEYTFNSSNESFKMSGYNFKYLITDLENMLFTDTRNKPWNDKKSLKRIIRVLMFYVIELTYNPDKNVLFSEIKNFSLFINNLNLKLKGIYINKLNVFHLESIMEYPKDSIFLKIYRCFNEYFEKILESTFDEYNLVVKFVNEIREYFVLVKQFISKLEKDNSFSPLLADIVSFKVTQFGGNLNKYYKHKYEKYKKKYIMLKK